MKFIGFLSLLLILFSCINEQKPNTPASPGLSAPAFGSLISPVHLNPPPFFLVDSTWLKTDGSITNVSIARGVSPSLDAEAM